ncbi:MAG TPA: tetratricopeptide repeat protein [Flavisolibacter sp.]|nr:tetratricopeptide repeat protein [Flavisolibacter sp.]
MKLFLILFSLGLATASLAQSPTEQTPAETARGFMRTGDWDNAILVLNRALQQDPNNLSLQKDLTLSYYYKRDYSKALDHVKPLLERDDADVVVYQIAGNVYKALEEVKDADKMYKKALKKFPNSGALYSEYGELLWAKNDYEAIKYWEKGIEADPSNAGNYYNAALYYYYTKDKIWTLIYGEIFVNMEYLTERATQMKKLLLSAYKEKLYADMKDDKTKSPFAKAVFQTFDKQASLVSKGITTESLNMIRTRFILDWFASYGKKYPFKLFDYQQQLIRDGMFEAYNQWLFGAVENLPAYDQWSKNNPDAFNKFSAFQKSRVFKMPSGQYYQEL